MTNHADPAGDYWHFDKRIPVASMLTGAAMAAGLVFWGASMDARLTAVETTNTSLQQAVERLSEDRARLVRIETIVESLARYHRNDDRARERGEGR